MQLIVTIDVNISTGRASWLVQSDPPLFDGADSADSPDQALDDAVAWIRQCDKN